MEKEDITDKMLIAVGFKKKISVLGSVGKDVLSELKYCNFDLKKIDKQYFTSLDVLLEKEKSPGLYIWEGFIEEHTGYDYYHTWYGKFRQANMQDLEEFEIKVPFDFRGGNVQTSFIVLDEEGGI